MEKTYNEKIQGDGSLSWVCVETEKGQVINKYMVYENPYKNSFVEEFKKLTQEELNQIKTLLK